MDPEEEAAAAMSSDEDEFYDRTADGRQRRTKKGPAAAKAPVYDAESLYAQKVRHLFPPSPLSPNPLFGALLRVIWSGRSL